MAAAVEDWGDLTVSQKADGFAGGNAGLIISGKRKQARERLGVELSIDYRIWKFDRI